MPTCGQVCPVTKGTETIRAGCHLDPELGPLMLKSVLSPSYLNHSAFDPEWFSTCFDISPNVTMTCGMCFEFVRNSLRTLNVLARGRFMAFLSFGRGAACQNREYELTFGSFITSSFILSHL